jgi:hypothetical protein
VIRRGAAAGAAAAATFLLSLLLFWPGTALFDTVDQYRQALTGDYTDWHPPIMARLWSVFAPLWPGTAPMLLLQLGLYWLGLGLLAAALARRGLRWAACAALAMGAMLLLPGWMGAILKDAQMTGALAAATGIAGWYGLEERRRPRWATAAMLLLLAYATLVRSNAVFATVPLGLALFGWGGVEKGWMRVAVCTAAIITVLALSPLVNRRLLGASREGPENSLLLYDIVGTSVRSGTDSAGIPAARWRALAAAGCYSSAEWDPLSEPGPCTVAPGIDAQPETPPLYGLWLRTILRHPLAYAGHRLAHFDNTMRLFIPANLPRAVAPIDSEPNRLGLGTRPGHAKSLAWAAGLAWGALPLAWPALWLALALVGLWAARTAPLGPERRLASALLLSSACGGVSYALVSVAPDLRYHLWTMLASGLGLAVLSASGGLARRHILALVGAAATVAAVGLAGRFLLVPLPPPT